MNTYSTYYKKIISLAVITCFVGSLMSQGASAYTGIDGPNSGVEGFKVSLNAASYGNAQLKELVEDVPWNYVSLGHVHAGQSNRLYVHIQDPHSNFGGQSNLALALKHYAQRHGIANVFVEGSAYEVTLDWTKDILSQHEREALARNLFNQGAISGEEKLNLTWDYPLKLLGLEDEELYKQNLNAYIALYQLRTSAIQRVSVIQAGIDKIKSAAYPSVIQQYEKTQTNSTTSELNGLDFVIKHVQGNEYADLPAVNKMISLKELESKIDFHKANQQMQLLVHELSKQKQDIELEALIHNLSSSQSSQRTQYAAYKQLIHWMDVYDVALDDSSELVEYINYLGEFTVLDMNAYLNEFSLLESRFYEFNLDKNSLLLRHIDEYTHLLAKAFKIQLSTKEFGRLKHLSNSFNTQTLIAYLNRQLIDLGWGESLIQGWESLANIYEQLNTFYELVDQRDQVFVDRAQSYIDDSESKTSFLIAGGYHTDHLTELWRQRGDSYIVLTPLVTDETDSKLYEKVLLAGLPLKSDSVLKQATNTIRKRGLGTVSGLDTLRLDTSGALPARLAGLSLKKTNSLYEKHKQVSAARMAEADKPYFRFVSNKLKEDSLGESQLLVNLKERINVLVTSIQDLHDARVKSKDMDDETQKAEMVSLGQQVIQIQKLIPLKLDWQHSKGLGSKHALFQKTKKQLMQQRSGLQKNMDVAQENKNYNILSELNQNTRDVNYQILLMQLKSAEALLIGATSHGLRIQNNLSSRRRSAISTLQGAITSIESVEDELEYQQQRLDAKRIARAYITVNSKGKVVYVPRSEKLRIQTLKEPSDDGVQKVSVRKFVWFNPEVTLKRMVAFIEAGEYADARRALSLLRSVYFIDARTGFTPKDANVHIRAVQKAITTFHKFIDQIAEDSQSYTDRRESIQALVATTIDEHIRQESLKAYHDQVFRDQDAALRAHEEHIPESISTETAKIIGRITNLNYYSKVIERTVRGRVLSKRLRVSMIKSLLEYMRWANDGRVKQKRALRLSMANALSHLFNQDILVSDHIKPDNMTKESFEEFMDDVQKHIDEDQFPEPSIDNYKAALQHVQQGKNAMLNRKKINEDVILKGITKRASALQIDAQDRSATNLIGDMLDQLTTNFFNTDAEHTYTQSPKEDLEQTLVVLRTLFSTLFSNRAGLDINTLPYGYQRIYHAIQFKSRRTGDAGLSGLGVGHLLAGLVKTIDTAEDMSPQAQRDLIKQELTKGLVLERLLVFQRDISHKHSFRFRLLIKDKAKQTHATASEDRILFYNPGNTLETLLTRSNIELDDIGNKYLGVNGKGMGAGELRQLALQDGLPDGSAIVIANQGVRMADSEPDQEVVEDSDLGDNPAFKLFIATFRLLTSDEAKAVLGFIHTVSPDEAMKLLQQYLSKKRNKPVVRNKPKQEMIKGEGYLPLSYKEWLDQPGIAAVPKQAFSIPFRQMGETAYAFKEIQNRLDGKGTTTPAVIREFKKSLAYYVPYTNQDRNEIGFEVYEMPESFGEADYSQGLDETHSVNKVIKEGKLSQRIIIRQHMNFLNPPTTEGVKNIHIQTYDISDGEDEDEITESDSSESPPTFTRGLVFEKLGTILNHFIHGDKLTYQARVSTNPLLKNRVGYTVIPDNLSPYQGSAELQIEDFKLGKAEKDIRAAIIKYTLAKKEHPERFAKNAPIKLIIPYPREVLDSFIKDFVPPLGYTAGVDFEFVSIEELVDSARAVGSRESAELFNNISLILGAFVSETIRDEDLEKLNSKADVWMTQLGIESESKRGPPEESNIKSYASDLIPTLESTLEELEAYDQHHAYTTRQLVSLRESVKDLLTKAFKPTKEKEELLEALLTILERRVPSNEYIIQLNGKPSTSPRSTAPKTPTPRGIKSTRQKSTDSKSPVTPALIDVEKPAPVAPAAQPQLVAKADAPEAVGSESPTSAEPDPQAAIEEVPELASGDDVNTAEPEQGLSVVNEPDSNSLDSYIRSIGGWDKLEAQLEAYGTGINQDTNPWQYKIIRPGTMMFTILADVSKDTAPIWADVNASEVRVNAFLEGLDYALDETMVVDTIMEFLGNSSNPGLDYITLYELVYYYATHEDREYAYKYLNIISGISVFDWGSMMSSDILPKIEINHIRSIKFLSSLQHHIRARDSNNPWLRLQASRYMQIYAGYHLLMAMQNLPLKLVFKERPEYLVQGFWAYMYLYSNDLLQEQHLLYDAMPHKLAAYIEQMLVWIDAGIVASPGKEVLDDFRGVDAVLDEFRGPDFKVSAESLNKLIPEQYRSRIDHTMNILSNMGDAVIANDVERVLELDIEFDDGPIEAIVSLAYIVTNDLLSHYQFNGRSRTQVTNLLDSVARSSADVMQIPFMLTLMRDNPEWTDVNKNSIAGLRTEYAVVTGVENWVPTLSMKYATMNGILSNRPEYSRLYSDSHIAGILAVMEGEYSNLDSGIEGILQDLADKLYYADVDEWDLVVAIDHFLTNLLRQVIDINAARSIGILRQIQLNLFVELLNDQSLIKRVRNLNFMAEIDEEPLDEWLSESLDRMYGLTSGDEMIKLQESVQAMMLLMAPNNSKRQKMWEEVFMIPFNKRYYAHIKALALKEAVISANVMYWPQDLIAAINDFPAEEKQSMGAITQYMDTSEKVIFKRLIGLSESTVVKWNKAIDTLNSTDWPALLSVLGKGLKSGSTTALGLAAYLRYVVEQEINSDRNKYYDLGDISIDPSQFAQNLNIFLEDHLAEDDPDTRGFKSMVKIIFNNVFSPKYLQTHDTNMTVSTLLALLFFLGDANPFDDDVSFRNAFINQFGIQSKFIQKVVLGGEGDRSEYDSLFSKAKEYSKFLDVVYSKLPQWIVSRHKTTRQPLNLSFVPPDKVQNEHWQKIAKDEDSGIIQVVDLREDFLKHFAEQDFKVIGVKKDYRDIIHGFRIEFVTPFEDTNYPELGSVKTMDMVIEWIGPRVPKDLGDLRVELSKYKNLGVNTNLMQAIRQPKRFFIHNVRPVAIYKFDDEEGLSTYIDTVKELADVGESEILELQSSMITFDEPTDTLDEINTDEETNLFREKVLQAFSPELREVQNQIIASIRQWEVENSIRGLLWYSPNDINKFTIASLEALNPRSWPLVNDLKLGSPENEITQQMSEQLANIKGQIEANFIKLNVRGVKGAKQLQAMRRSLKNGQWNALPSFEFDTPDLYSNIDPDLIAVVSEFEHIVQLAMQLWNEVDVETRSIAAPSFYQWVSESIAALVVMNYWANIPLDKAFDINSLAVPMDVRDTIKSADKNHPVDESNTVYHLDSNLVQDWLEMARDNHLEHILLFRLGEYLDRLDKTVKSGETSPFRAAVNELSRLYLAYADSDGDVTWDKQLQPLYQRAYMVEESLFKMNRPASANAAARATGVDILNDIEIIRTASTMFYRRLPYPDIDMWNKALHNHESAVFDLAAGYNESLSLLHKGLFNSSSLNSASGRDIKSTRQSMEALWVAQAKTARKLILESRKAQPSQALWSDALVSGYPDIHFDALVIERVVETDAIAQKAIDGFRGLNQNTSGEQAIQIYTLPASLNVDFKDKAIIAYIDAKGDIYYPLGDYGVFKNTKSGESISLEKTNNVFGIIDDGSSVLITDINNIDTLDADAILAVTAPISKKVSDEKKDEDSETNPTATEDDVDKQAIQDALKNTTFKDKDTQGHVRVLQESLKQHILLTDQYLNHADYRLDIERGGVANQSNALIGEYDLNHEYSLDHLKTFFLALHKYKELVDSHLRKDDHLQSAIDLIQATQNMSKAMADALTHLTNSMAKDLDMDAQIIMPYFTNLDSDTHAQRNTLPNSSKTERVIGNFLRKIRGNTNSFLIPRYAAFEFLGIGKDDLQLTSTPANLKKMRIFAVKKIGADLIYTPMPDLGFWQNIDDPQDIIKAADAATTTNAAEALLHYLGPKWEVLLYEYSQKIDSNADVHPLKQANILRMRFRDEVAPRINELFNTADSQGDDDNVIFNQLEAHERHFVNMMAEDMWMGSSGVLRDSENIYRAVPLLKDDSQLIEDYLKHPIAIKVWHRIKAKYADLLEKSRNLSDQDSTDESEVVEELNAPIPDESTSIVEPVIAADVVVENNVPAQPITTTPTRVEKQPVEPEYAKHEIDLMDDDTLNLEIRDFVEGILKIEGFASSHLVKIRDAFNRAFEGESTDGEIGVIINDLSWDLEKIDSPETRKRLRETFVSAVSDVLAVKERRANLLQSMKGKKYSPLAQKMVELIKRLARQKQTIQRLVLIDQPEGGVFFKRGSQQHGATNWRVVQDSDIELIRDFFFILNELNPDNNIRYIDVDENYSTELLAASFQNILDKSGVDESLSPAEEAIWNKLNISDDEDFWANGFNFREESVREKEDQAIESSEWTIAFSKSGLRELENKVGKNINYYKKSLRSSLRGYLIDQGKGRIKHSDWAPLYDFWITGKERVYWFNDDSHGRKRIVIVAAAEHDYIDVSSGNSKLRQIAEAGVDGVQEIVPEKDAQDFLESISVRMAPINAAPLANPMRVLSRDEVLADSPDELALLVGVSQGWQAGNIHPVLLNNSKEAGYQVSRMGPRSINQRAGVHIHSSRGIEPFYSEPDQAPRLAKGLKSLELSNRVINLSPQQLAQDFLRGLDVGVLRGAKLSLKLALTPVHARGIDLAELNAQLSRVIGGATSGQVDLELLAVNSLEEAADLSVPQSSSVHLQRIVTIASLAEINQIRDEAILKQLEEKGLLGTEGPIDIVLAVLAEVKTQMVYGNSGLTRRLARESLLLLQLHGKHLRPEALAQIQNFTGDLTIIQNNLAQLTTRFDLGQATLSAIETRTSA